jgi:hypothetical protein
MFRALRPVLHSQAAAAVYRRDVIYPLLTPTTPLYSLNFPRAFASGLGLARSDIEKRVLGILVNLA